MNEPNATKNERSSHRQAITRIMRAYMVFGICAIGGCQHRPSAVQQAARNSPVLTPANFVKMTDDQLDEAVRVAALSKLDVENDEELAAKSKMSKGVQMVIGTCMVEDEVNNGGFNQYFWNSSGKFAQMAADGYRLIGATKHVELIDRAIAIHKAEEPELRKFKEAGTTKAFSESYSHTQLNTLDKTYYDLEEQESVLPLRVKYIRDHPQEFSSN